MGRNGIVVARGLGEYGGWGGKDCWLMVLRDGQC